MDAVGALAYNCITGSLLVTHGPEGHHHYNGTLLPPYTYAVPWSFVKTAFSPLLKMHPRLLALSLLLPSSPPCHSDYLPRFLPERQWAHVAHVT